MKSSRATLLCVAVAALILPALIVPSVASATPKNHHSTVSVLASGLDGTSGSTIGPDGALYVTEAVPGEITRVDLRTGRTSTFASGLPPAVIGLGGVTDVAFVGRTAYALVTLVGPDVGGTNINGVYRIDDTDSHTVVADIGAWAIAHPPDTAFDIPSGLQFAIEPVHGGFLVSDGHHNRVLSVSMRGAISEMIQFGNTVPTGLATSGRTVYLAEAGAVPHLPADGKVVAFPLRGGQSTARTVASGYSLLVDVEVTCGSLFAVSQGDSPGDVPAGSPALPDSGELLKANRSGTFSVVASGLDLPVSLEITRESAYLVTLGGDVLKVAHVTGKGQCRGHGHH